MKKLFRYSGSKLTLLSKYRSVPKGIKRIVEPYLGSGSFVLNQKIQGIGFDTNSDIVAMWHWLQDCSVKDLLDLNRLIESYRMLKEKPDVREFNLELGPQTYVRINITSLVVGQLSSWKIYPQHRLPIEDTIECLSRIKDIEVINCNALEYRHEDGDFLFIDPPYVGTKANYLDNTRKTSQEKRYNPSSTIKLIDSTSNPIIFTYGTNAPIIFPQYDWEVVSIKSVPNMRLGGSIKRIEHVSYINW